MYIFFLLFLFLFIPSQRPYLLLTRGRNASQTALPDMELSPDTEYTLKRLIRGMGSNRKAARQGFGVVLCEVLATFPKVCTYQLYPQINSMCARVSKI